MLKRYFFQDNSKDETPCVFLLGGFDGIHGGHEKLLERAKRFSLPVGIMTIRGGKGEKSLFTLAEREQIFAERGVSFVFETEFSAEFRDTAAADFLRALEEKFCVRAFVCGKDFRFGKGAAGSAEFIRSHSPAEVIEEDICTDSRGNKISASRIKSLIAAGRIEEANAFLSSPFRVTGEVLRGRHVGSSLGFPTANLRYPQEKVPLKEGVYAVRVFVDGAWHGGIANYGGCPTFHVADTVLETYIDGFAGDLYGKTISVYPRRRLRDIVAFADGAGLKELLAKDLNAMREGEHL